MQSTGEPAALILTEEAKRRVVEFVNEHGREGETLKGTSLGPVWAKLESSAARFALVIHCIRDAIHDAANGPFDDARSVEAGITLARWFGYEARRVYSMLQESVEEQKRRRLLESIQAAGERVTVRQLMQSTKLYSTADEWESVLDGLVKAGLGRWDYPTPKATGGRPTKYFILSPAPADGTQDIFGDGPD